jgi:hypothetical protein
VEDDGVPDDDEQRAVLLRVPAPEAAPRLVGPDAAEDGADEAEQRGEAHDAVDHADECVGGGLVQRAGEDAAEDVDEGQETGEKGGGVADGDDHHMRRQPEVRVEHRAHHLERVAGEREVVGDQEGGEADEPARHAADAVAEEFLQEEAEQDGAPADEQGRGVKVRDRRPALKPHAGEDADGGRDPGERQQPEGGAGEFLRPLEPGDDGEEEGQHVERHAAVEGLGGVEAGLDVALPHLRGEALRQLVVQAQGDAVELGGDAVAPGVAELGVFHDGGVDPGGAEGVEQGRADGPPVGRIGVACGRRHEAKVAELLHVAEAVGHFPHDLHRVGVVLLAPLLGEDGGDAGGQGFFKLLQLGQEIGGVGHLHAGLELQVEDDAVAHGDDLLLERGAQRLFDAVGEARLLLELGQLLAELGVGEAFAAVAVRWLHAEQVEHLVVLDEQAPVGVGLGGREQHVGQPLGRGEGAALGRHEPLAALQGEQGGAGDGVEGLDAAVDQHRHAAQVVQLEVGPVGLRPERRAQVGEAENEDEEGKKTFHQISEERVAGSEETESACLVILSAAKNPGKTARIALDPSLRSG